MRIRRSLIVLVQAIGLLSVDPHRRSSAAGDETPPSEASIPVVRWIGAGGGFDPRSTQVSLEQDLVLARNVLGPDGGLLFFAGGADAFGVQVLNPKAPAPSLIQRLGDLLDPKEGRDARFRRPRLKPDGPATADNVLAALQEALAHGNAPLLLYVAAHGEMGESPRDNRALLWSGTELSVGALAKALDEGARQRQVRVVVTSCYSGGFADIVFAGADPAQGAAGSDRCGFFASEWDQVSSGCDPDPDRRTQQGYGMHFLQALRGRSRGGQLLADKVIDFNHDGRISLLEAHTRARLSSASIDVPTTASERWLRQAAPLEGASEDVALPEEDIVIAVLNKQLKVADEAAAREQQENLGARMEKLKRKLDAAENEESMLYERLRVALLERWPALDDPWHPLFRHHIWKHGESIESFLQSAPEVAVYKQAQRTLDERGIRYDQARFHAAILQRLIRAYENRTLAARLHAAGGAAWKRYEQLLACERGFP
jgi:hypothetical protein